jgi:hypothetical protein
MFLAGASGDSSDRMNQRGKGKSCGVRSAVRGAAEGTGTWRMVALVLVIVNHYSFVEAEEDTYSDEEY